MKSSEAIVSTIAVSPELGKAITAMHTQLVKEFGSDYAFTICGNGSVISASSHVRGHVIPLVKVSR